MKIFFKSLFASLIALFLFTGAAIVLLVAFAAMGSSKPSVPDRAVLMLDLTTDIPDSTREASPAEAIQRGMLGQDREPLSLRSLILQLDRAAKDPKIAGLYLTGNLLPAGYGAGPAALKELREAIQRFKKDSGKPVLAYNEFWTKREYYLCAGAGSVVTHPTGVFDITGLASEPMFFGDAFKKYGIDVQVSRVGKFKSAVEPFITDRMSEPSRQQTQSLLDDIWSEWKSTVAADRKLAPAAIQTLADDKGLLTAEEAKAEGLVDRVAAYEEVLAELKKIAGKGEKDKDFPQIAMDVYTQVPGAVPKGKNRIAVVYAEGNIVEGEGGPGAVGGDRVSRELRRLRLDSGVKAIVLRVNSPGGTVTASDLMQREVVLARQSKPVVVSMGTVAASGGYWISAFADRIFAEPNTITGSIGVFAMIPNLKKLANEHGVTFDLVQTSKLAGMTSTLFRPRSEAEMARLQAYVDRTYAQFKTKVAEGRKLKLEAVEEIAQGRVWSGLQAQKLGLVDELGGLDAAIRHAAKLAKIEGDFRVDPPGVPKKPIEKLLESLGGEKHRPLARGPFGQLQREVEQRFAALAALDDPTGVYVRMPFDLNLR